MIDSDDEKKLQAKTALERELILQERHQKMKELMERYELHKLRTKANDDIVSIYSFSNI